ncbi:MAG: TrbI/VirB10 family protein [Nostoc sp. ChiSLP02]|nr:TrbI/VirB10 family protein [Nostoc sp. DedSLP05]MDZ8101686.1 TrbI/VirB10 family protein [Nostoc sp. DedSLP01]MDZ8185040.1 TrbI/VirB10 family protein [Nostoc sp. ChiSLP02]
MKNQTSIYTIVKDSISSKISAQNLSSLNSDEPPLEVESLDWESQIARLVGLAEECHAIEVPALEDTITLEKSVSQSQELEAQEFFLSNRFAKLGLVGTATLAIVLLTAGFLFQLMNASSQKLKNNIVVLQGRSQLTTASTSQELEEEIEILKTKLALTQQAESIEATQKNLKSEKLKLPQLTATSDVKSSGDSRSKQPITLQRTPIQTVFQPEIVTVKQVPQPSQLPAIKPDNQSVVDFTPSPTPNPIQEWKRLAKLGSYGQVNITDKPNSRIATNPPIKNIQVVRQIPNSNPNQIQSLTTSIVSQVQSSKPKLVPAGTSVKAVLATAVFGETTKAKTNNNQDDNNNVFVGRLKQPLKSVDGAIALPANTEFLIKIRSISQQGLLKLDVVKVILENNRTLTQKSLAQNAMVIRAPQGKPLIADQFPERGSSIAGIDVGLFFLGGASKAAELSNRTDSQTTITTNGTQYTSDNPRGNTLAGLVEGGIKTVLPTIFQRNQQAISKIRMQRTNIWFLHAGKDIEIYVNQAMEF